MCNVCGHQETGLFIQPRPGEDLHTWFHRLEHMDAMQLAVMEKTKKDLHAIATSYDLQGFTYWSEPGIVNCLVIRDLIFVTYGPEFATIMGWSR